MRIFLSYASEQRPIAEQIAYTLRVRGHFAFFDKEQLPVADSFDEQISLAIDTSDVLIFLISPEAVTPGRYTLTELVFARKKMAITERAGVPSLGCTDTTANDSELHPKCSVFGNRGKYCRGGCLGCRRANPNS